MQRNIVGLLVSLLVLGPWAVPNTYALGWGAVGKWINPQTVAAVAAVTHSSPAVRLTELKTTQAMYDYLNGCRVYFAAVADYAADVAQQEATGRPLTMNPNVAAPQQPLTPASAGTGPKKAVPCGHPAHAVCPIACAIALYHGQARGQGL